MLAIRLSFALTLLPGCLAAQVVQITPLGLKTGELCFADRAMIMEDPTGVRLLYDPGNVIAGSTDSRLGTIHVTLLSHVHQDHIGIARLNQNPNDPAAACDRSFARVPTVPNSNLAEITARRNAAFIAPPPVASFLGVRMGNILGAAIGICGGDQASTEPVILPVSTACVSPLNFGGTRTVRLASAAGEIRISVVTAKHDNTQETQLVFDPLGSELASQGLYLSSGDPAGYVITFSNGLTVYLSGDTGPISDMSTIVRGHYRADLAIVNIGDVFTSGPEEAAFEVNSLVHPKAVIPSHVNEVATSGGKVIPGTKTARFLDLIEMAGYVPLSGRTMGFDKQGHCVAGCN
jgi:L-ascorbate metabolism protein UlaG (beta-lactamase superfamily)